MEVIEFVPSGNNEEMVKVNVPQDEFMQNGYWGVVEGETIPQNDNKKSGQLTFGGEFIAQFENTSQAIASLYFTRFSFGQIIALLPHLSTIGEIKLSRILQNKAGRRNRYDFILPLVGNAPRKLTQSEYLAIVGKVGNPAAKPKAANVIAIREMIEADIQNVELIKPAPKQASKVRIVDPEKVRKQLDIIQAKLVMKEKRVEIGKGQLEQLKMKKQIPNIEDNIKIKTTKIEYDEMVIEKYKRQIGKLTAKLA